MYVHNASYNQKCSFCGGKKYFINVDSKYNILAKSCSECEKSPSDAEYQNAICEVFNKIGFNLNKNISDYTLRQKKMIPDELHNLFFEFSKNWIKHKRELTKRNIIDNPDEYSLVKKMHTSHVTTLNLLARNAVFQIISRKERGLKYTKISELDGKEVDIPVLREFMGWGDHKFTICGPLLDTYDQQVFYACLKIHHENGFKGLKVETTISEIWEKMGNSTKIGGSSLKSIKRSLKRLHNVTMSVESLDSKKYWGGPLLQNLTYQSHDNPKYFTVEITFNNHIVPLYLTGAYCTLNINNINKFNAYARRIYEFLMSHKDPERSMSLEKWRAVLGVSEETSNKVALQRIKEGLEELKLEKVIKAESCVLRKKSGVIINTFLTEEAHKNAGETLESAPANPQLPFRGLEGATLE